jgi:hypothetical protein
VFYPANSFEARNSIQIRYFLNSKTHSSLEDVEKDSQFEKERIQRNSDNFRHSLFQQFHGKKRGMLCVCLFSFKPKRFPQVTVIFLQTALMTYQWENSNILNFASQGIIYVLISTKFGLFPPKQLNKTLKTYSSNHKTVKRLKKTKEEPNMVYQESV